MNTNQTALVLIEGKSYKRFVGRTLTNHIISDRELDSEEVEHFRCNPLTFIGESV